jgi:hypothetical protein
MNNGADTIFNYPLGLGNRYLPRALCLRFLRRLFAAVLNSFFLITQSSRILG